MYRVYIIPISCVKRRTVPPNVDWNNINTMQPTSNNTQEDGMVDPAAQARFPVMVSVYIPAFLISEIGNGFVIYSLAYLKRRQRTAIDCYILNLAIGDILLTTLSLFNAVEYMNNAWALGEAMCKIHGQMMEVCYTVSTLTLLVISYDRRKVVQNRLKVLDAKKTLKRNIAIIWLAAFLLTSPLSYAYTVAKRNGRFHCSNTNFDKVTRQIYYLLQAIILFFIPVSVMIGSHRKITRGLRQHSEIYKNAVDTKNAHFNRVMTHERRVGKFLTYIWVVFVCCLTPHITMRTINHFTSLRRTNEIWNQIWHVSQLVALLNSAVNPSLYYRTTNRVGSDTSSIVKFFCCIRGKNERQLGSSNRQLLTSSQTSNKIGNISSKV